MHTPGMRKLLPKTYLFDIDHNAILKSRIINCGIIAFTKDFIIVDYI